MTAPFAHQGREVKPPPAIGSADCGAAGYPRIARVAVDLQTTLRELRAAGGEPPIVESPRSHQRVPVLAALAHAGGNRIRAARELGLTDEGLRLMVRRWRREDQDARHRLVAFVREAS